MKTTSSRANAEIVPTAEQIAEMADAGENVTRFFSGNGRMMQPGQRINVDFTASMIDEPYVAAAARPAATSTSGLDGRHRDEDGRISEKHGNTLASNLRETSAPPGRSLGENRSKTSSATAKPRPLP